MKAHSSLITLFIILNSASPVLAAPTITVQPRDQLALPGQRITLTTAASGIAPLTFQWQREGAALAGRTTTSLLFTNIQVGDAGNYSVVATDASGSATSRVAAVAVLGPVALDPKLSTNMMLGQDPPQLVGAFRNQKEPHIARSFTDPNLLLVAVHDGWYNEGGAISCSYAASTNGGLDWTRQRVPGITTNTGGTAPRGGDIVAAIDLAGDFFLSTLTVSTPPNVRGLDQLISRSTNRGASFGAPTVMFASTATVGSDKNWIAANTFAAAPHPNRLAVAFSKVTSIEQAFCAISDDSGTTWSTPIAIGPSDSGQCQPFFLPDGALAVIYWHWLTTSLSGPSRIELALSPDGGEHFNAPLPVQSLSVVHQDPIALNAGWNPSAASDRQAGVMYVAYEGFVSNVPRILFTRSRDRGLSWSAPMAVNDTPGGKSVFCPALAVSPDGQHVTVAFYDKRHQTTNSAENYVDFYLAESFDAGETWQPNLRLSEVSTDLRLLPLVFDLWRNIGEYFGNVPALNFNVPGVAVWIDTRNGNSDPYAVRITRTRGTSFETWRKLRWGTNDLANPAISGENADLEADGIPNLAEYACALEPMHVDAGPLKIAQNNSDPNSTVIASYERLAVLSDIQFRWESSTNLIYWSAIAPIQEQVSLGRDPSIQRVEVTFTAGEQMRFLRLGIVRLTTTQ